MKISWPLWKENTITVCRYVRAEALEHKSRSYSTEQIYFIIYIFQI